MIRFHLISPKPTDNEIIPTNKIIPNTFLKKDYEACLKGRDHEHENAQKVYCQCLVDRMKDGMNFSEYLLLSAEISPIKDASKLVKLKFAMSKEKLGLWVQDCVKMAITHYN